MQPDLLERSAESQNLAWLENSSLEMLTRVLIDKVAGETAIVSSFGAESAVRLWLVVQVDKDAPVLFIDTQMMFQETLDYQRELADHLGLRNVRVISADATEIRRNDVFGRLHLKDTDACCHLRKVVPLETALEGYEAWVTGRKRHQSASRADIRPFEVDEASGKTKINPLLHWDRADIEACFAAHDLPRHPLVADGFTSIGCAPCTAKPIAGADPRSGRWAGQDKTECGIHVVGGRIERVAS